MPAYVVQLSEAQRLRLRLGQPLVLGKHGVLTDEKTPGKHTISLRYLPAVIAGRLHGCLSLNLKMGISYTVNMSWYGSYRDPLRCFKLTPQMEI